MVIFPRVSVCDRSAKSPWAMTQCATRPAHHVTAAVLLKWKEDTRGIPAGCRSLCDTRNSTAQAAGVTSTVSVGEYLRFFLCEVKITFYPYSVFSLSFSVSVLD
jgi:hypothetical protein